MTNAPWLAPAFPAVLALSLSACTSLGADTFVFEGDLPANFGIEAQAHYSPLNECSTRTLPKSFKTDIRDSAQHYRFQIPTRYSKGTCTLQLERIGLYIRGRYGDKDWQRSYDNGGLVVVDSLPKGAPDFEASGELRKVADCTWLFQLSKARARLGQISKLLICKNAGAHLPKGNLAGKTVRLDFELAPEEKPAIRQTWIKLNTGWKPCAEENTPQGKWIWCRTPPTFRTFQMNDRECTVYPNCTE